MTRLASPAGAALAGIVAGTVRTEVLAHERVLDVLPPLAGLLPGRGLRRASIVACSGGAGVSLALALAAGPSAAGAWVGVVGLPAIGLTAAAELGVALERTLLVATPPPRRWAEVVAAVAEGTEVVLARAPSPAEVRPAEARRLRARLAGRGSVLLLVGPAGEPVGADIELSAVPLGWEGIGAGHGRLAARRVRVDLGGRRAGRPAGEELWLPGPDGSVAVAVPRPIPLHPAVSA